MNTDSLRTYNVGNGPLGMTMCVSDPNGRMIFQHGQWRPVGPHDRWVHEIDEWARRVQAARVAAGKKPL